MDYRQARIIRTDDKYVDYYTNNIEIDKIDSICNARFFKSMTKENKKINDILIKLCKDVVIESYNNGGKEAGAVYDNKRHVFALHDADGSHGIDFLDTLIKDVKKKGKCYNIITTAEKYTCVVIHNHNGKNSFSAQDIATFITSNETIAIIVITSDMRIRYITKDRNKSYSKLLHMIENLYKTDYITTEIRNSMIEHGLIERSAL